MTTVPVRMAMMMVAVVMVVMIMAVVIVAPVTVILSEAVIVRVFVAGGHLRSGWSCWWR